MNSLTKSSFNDIVKKRSLTRYSMSEPRLYGDRYHYTQLQFSQTEHAKDAEGKSIGDKKSIFYVTQRKKPFAPCVGHERLRKSMVELVLDAPRLRFLRADKAGLDLAADALAKPAFPYSIRTFRPGTIMFAGEPMADIRGPFGMNQMMEIKFEHAFDEPMTVAGNALAIRLAAGDIHASDFSNRRDGNEDSAIEDAKYSYIGGFDDTSNMEAAFLVDLNPTGTMAHYTVEAFIDWMYKTVPVLHENGKAKHFQEIAFERWLDAHPKGTTLLLDTISVKLGTIHAIRAAKSMTSRRLALKFVRIDSGDLISHARWVRAMLDANDLQDVGIILTSDLDADSVKEIVSACPFIAGFGIGTKLKAETKVAGVIFKLCQIGNHHTMKCSETLSKSTLPGYNQVWRYVDKEGYYIKDVISIEYERPHGDFEAIPLLQPFDNPGQKMEIPLPAQQREYVFSQLKKFRNIYEYPVELSESLKIEQERLAERLHHDDAGETDVVMV